MRICVIGTGAIGTLYAARLALAGHEVTMLSSSAGTAAAIARDGLRLEEPDGAHAVPMRAAADPAALPRAEAALVLTDATRTAAAAGLAAGVLEADGFAVTLQNGIGNAEILADALGEARVAAGVTYHSAAGERPGHARHTNDGRTIMGEVDGRRSPRLDRLAAALGDTGFKVTVSDDVTGAIWSKLVLNCAVNPICAVTGLRTGEIALSPDADAVQDGIVAEALAVVAAKGIRLSFDDPVARVKRLTRAVFNKPSMLQHMEAARPTEIDALNGALAREGRALGLAMPVNETVSRLVRAQSEKAVRLAREGEPDYAALEAAARGRG